MTYLCSLKISSSFLLAFRVYSYFHPSVGRCKAFSSSFCLEQLLIIFLQCSYGSKRAGTWDFSHNVCVHLYVCDWSSAQSLTFHFNLAKLVNFNRLEDYRSSGKYTKIISGQKLLEQISVLRKVYLFNLGYKYSGCNIKCFFPGILNEKSFHWIFHPIGKFHFIIYQPRHVVWQIVISILHFNWWKKRCRRFHSVLKHSLFRVCKRSFYSAFKQNF